MLNIIFIAAIVMVITVVENWKEKIYTSLHFLKQDALYRIALYQQLGGGGGGGGGGEKKKTI